MTLTPLLDRLNANSKAALLICGNRISLEPGEFLTHDGDNANSVSLVVNGLLKVVKTSMGGRVSFIGLRGPGTMLGELGLLSPARRSASLQVVTPSTIVKISAQDFDVRLSEDPHLSRALLEDLAERLREATDQIHDLMTANAASRVATRLVHLADSVMTTDPSSQSLALALPVSQQELGEWAGLSRAGVVKALRGLREDGMIDTSRMTIRITDLPALRNVSVT